MIDLPEVISPDVLARHLGFSERRVRADARRLGQCFVLGNRILLTQKHVDALMEAWRPEPKDNRPDRKDGPSAHDTGYYAELVRLREKKAKTEGATRVATRQGRQRK